MKTNFTPGPWKVASKNYIHAVKPTGYIAFIPPDHEDCAANATLVAAAPDLYAALASMEEMFARKINGEIGPNDAAQRWDNARAALAKARGE